MSYVCGNHMRYEQATSIVAFGGKSTLLSVLEAPVILPKMRMMRAYHYKFHNHHPNQASRQFWYMKAMPLLLV